MQIDTKATDWYEQACGIRRRIDIKPCQYWGWYMNSQENAEAFKRVLQETHELHPDGISYLEIGLGNCGTINAVDFMLAQIPGNHTITGIEVEGWTQKYLTPLASEIIIGGREKIPNREFDIVLIDGCHCKQCVIDDFNSVSFHLAPGGFIIFHDTDDHCQGIHDKACESPHQKKGIEVKSALEELGLPNEDWELFHSTVGRASEWHGLNVFRKM